MRGSCWSGMWINSPRSGRATFCSTLSRARASPTVRLETVFRQASLSGIVANAHRINRGDQPLFNSDDFFFIERDTPGAALETVLELVSHRIPAKFQLDALRDIQVLAPMHRGEAGVKTLNERLQAALNPGGTTIGGKFLRVGDKVIQTRNNYELDVYNGDVGIIAAVDDDALEVSVKFDDRSIQYPFEDLDNLVPRVRDYGSQVARQRVSGGGVAFGVATLSDAATQRALHGGEPGQARRRHRGAVESSAHGDS